MIISHPEPRAQSPEPRLLELNAAAKERDLTPQEEGERRGWFAHPDNPEGRSLLQKEYLTSEGLGEMTDEERERLRLIRVEQYKWMGLSEKRTDGEERSSQRADLDPVDPKRQAEASAAALSVLHTQAKIADIENPSWKRDPKEVIDEMIEAMPHETTVYTKDTLHLLPKDGPSPLALYMMGKMRGLPKLTDDKAEGALGVLESIACLDDQVRTKKFLSGVKEAVQDLEASAKEIITMCDAGSGALPVLAIYAALCSEKIRCTALELNPNSAAIARQVVEGFGLQDRIQVLQADATTFTPDGQFDFLVSETMHSGLTQEPMVQIFSNLAQYVKEDGVRYTGPNKLHSVLRLN